jgi:hypothetical protein
VTANREPLTPHVADAAGKYNDGIPEGSRLTAEGYGFLRGKREAWLADGTLDKVAV